MASDTDLLADAAPREPHEMSNTGTPRRARLNDDAALAATYTPRSTGTAQFLWDGGRSAIPGFGLKMTPTAAASRPDGKAWIFQYRTHDGASRRLTLGSAKAMNAAAARKAAAAALAAVRGGRDPQAEKAKARNARTVMALAEEWLASCERRVEQTEAERREREAGRGLRVLRRSGVKDARAMSRETLDGYRAKVRVHISRAFGRLRPEELTREAVVRWRDRPTGTKSRPLSEGGVNTVLRVLAAFCGWAVERGELRANPAIGLGQYAIVEAGDPLSAHEVARLNAVLDRRERANPIHVAAIRLILLTGCRLHEALRLRWEDVEATEGRVRIVRDKTERQTGVKEILLTEALRDVLQSVARLRVSGCPYVFPSTAKRRRTFAAPALRRAEPRNHPSHLGKTAIEKFWRSVRSEAELTEGGRRRLHDLRHTAGTLAGQAGVSDAEIAVMLGHASTATTRRYVRRDASRAAAAAHAVAAAVAAGRPRAEV
jgi:integrase